MPQTVTAVLTSVKFAAFMKGVFGFAFSSLVSRAFRPKLKEPDMGDLKGYGVQVNTQSSKVNLPLIYGVSRVGINRAYVTSSGADNQYLHIIGLLGEGEIEGFSDQIDGVDPLYLNNKLYTEFRAENVYYELFCGSSDQAVCATLHSAVPEWTDPLRYTAYIYVRLKFDRDKFQGLPDITVGVKGLKVLNPDTGDRAYSSNPALCCFDMMTRSPYRGGFGISADRIKTTSVETARSYCAAKGWTCNMPVRDNNPVTDNIQLILNNFRGEVIKGATLFEIRFKDLNHEAVVMSLGESDDIIASSFSVQQPDVFNTPTAVTIEYLAAEGGPDGTSTYKERSFTISQSGAVVDEAYNAFSIQCLGLSGLNSVQQMAYYFLERLVSNKTCSFAAGQKAAQLEPMDLIQVTHTVPGWSKKYLRVEHVSLNPDFTVNLKCIEENPAFYDSVYDPDSASWHDTILPDPGSAPYPVINVSLSETVYFYRGRSFTRLECNFDPPAKSDDPFFDYVEVYLKVGAAGSYKYMTKSGGNYLVDPVEEGEIYYLKLITVNIFGVRQPDGEAIIVSKTIEGKSTIPSDLSYMSAAANGDSVSIFADPVNDPDIDGYEVRLGDAWDGGIFISFNKNCSLRLNGVRPGTHTFWMSPMDNAGRYSGTPVSATVKVFIPPGYTQLPVYGCWTWDFNAGTHDNTEHTIYNSEDALKCSHAGGVLSGTFISPTYDLGAVEDVRIWGDFRTVFVSGATTWDGVAPAGRTWNDLGSGSWMEIFQPTEAGKVEAALKFSADGSNWSSVDFFQVLCAEVTARYLKVEIKLTDPTLDSNLYLKELNMAAYTGPQG